MLTEQIRVRVTPDERQAIQAAAAGEQRTMSDRARLRLRIAAGLPDPLGRDEDEADSA